MTPQDHDIDDPQEALRLNRADATPGPPRVDVVGTLLGKPLDVLDAVTLSATDIEAVRHVAAGCDPAKALADLFVNARERQECAAKLARLGLIPMPRETQASVHRWIDETFPGTDPESPRKSIRVLEEVVELCLASGARIDEIIHAAAKAAHGSASFGQLSHQRRMRPDKIPAEAADVLIVLYGVAGMRGFDLHAEVDRKMAVNRHQREWIAVGDGTGYHKKNP